MVIDIFDAGGDCDASLHGEAAVYLGTTTATLGPDGIFSFSKQIQGAAAGIVSATASAGPSGRNTSQLSPCFFIPGATPQLVINEVDVTGLPGATRQFVEIFNTAAGPVPLHGLVLVFYDGASDESYAAFDLTGLTTDQLGYFLAGDEDLVDVDLVLPDGLLETGADAVALHDGTAAQCPDGTPVTTADLVDAVVYDTGQPDDPGLLVLLNEDQPQVDESGAGDAPAHSNQRCANGSGGQRNSDTFAQALPTPGADNRCVICQLDPPAALTAIGGTHTVVATVLLDLIEASGEFGDIPFSCAATNEFGPDPEVIFADGFER